MNKPRLLLVGVTLPEIGGVSLTIEKMRHNRLLQEFADVHVCNPNPYRNTFVDKFLTRFLHYPYNSQASLVRVKASIKEVKPDIIHLFTSSNASFWTNSYLAEYFHRAGIPYLMNMRGGGFANFYNGSTPGQRKKIVRSLLLADVILVQSQEWEDFYRSLDRAIETAVLPNYVLMPEGASPEREKAVIFLGHLRKSKGVTDLLAVWSMNYREIPDWSLWMVGPDKEGFEERYSEEELQNQRLVFHGLVIGSPKDDLLARSSIYVLPSEAEGLPNAMLEAMAHRVPVIVTPVGAVPGIVKHEKSGMVVQVGDRDQLQQALKKLIDSEQLRTSIGNAGFEVVQSKHSEFVFTEKLTEVYRGILR
jgi:glycosyltransferase involved in cell wall biosynthesis